MALDTVKNLFPAPLLSPWIENRLFPILHTGGIRLELLSLKGRADQFQNLHLPENQSALTLRFECRNFMVSANGVEEPFKGTSAHVILEKGTLIISRLRGNFGRSAIRDSNLRVKNLFSTKPSFEGAVGGSFDLQDLIRQRGMDLIPDDVRRRLDQVQSLSGNLEGRAGFLYEYGWEFPHIMSGEFVFKDLSVKQKALFFPLALKETRIFMDEKNQNRIAGKGSWGNSTFRIRGTFGISGKGIDLQRADVSADVDMSEVLPFFYDIDQLPVGFSGPIPWQISVTGERDLWSVKGKVDLKGVAFEAKEFIMDPPGRGDRIVFDLDYKPKGSIDLKKSLLNFNGSPIEVSGSYDLRTQDIFTLKVSAPSLSLEDLGFRFKEKTSSAKGILKGNLNVRGSRENPLTTDITGHIEGKNLFLDFGQLPSPIDKCNFRLGFSGKKVAIVSGKMKICESPIHIR